MTFGMDPFGRLAHAAESLVFGATDFDIDKKNPIFGTVAVKWVDSTQTYHYKAFGMDDWADTGKSSASDVKNSTTETKVGSITHSVASKMSAGQGLEFETLSPADSPVVDPDDDDGDDTDTDTDADTGDDGTATTTTPSMPNWAVPAGITAVALVAILALK